METIERVDKSACCGCAACLNICPANAIHLSGVQGFPVPIVDKEKCVLCGKCVKVCGCVGEKKRTYSEMPGEAFLYTSGDRKVMAETSSGGFFTKLVTDVINEGGVVFSPAFDEQWSVRFIEIDSKDRIWRIRGSKYVEAYIGRTYRKVGEKILHGKKVLFSGTPCQVSGLKSYLEQENIPLQNNLILVAVVCHGNASSDYFGRFLRHISGRKKVKSVNFREKTYGYSTSTLAVKFDDGTVYHESYDNGYYLPAFFGGIP